MRILILTSYTPANVYLVNYLTERKDVVAKVIEQRPLPVSFGAKMDARMKLVRRHGLVKTLNKLLYNKYSQRYLHGPRNATLRRSLWGNAEVGYAREIPTIEVDDINSAEVISFVKEHAPDVIAVCGTGIIRPKVFTLPPLGTINIHCGITPEYRSADTIFWALYNNEPDKIGVTIHFVDKGVDTGGIIFQETVEVTGSDDIATINAKCIRRGAELMDRALGEIESGTVSTVVKEGVKSKAYYHIDLGLVQYLIFRRRFRKLKERLGGTAVGDRHGVG